MQHVDDARGERDGITVVLDEHGELVAPEPSRGVTRTRRARDALGNAQQELVSGAVAQAVVDELEVVEVEEEHGERPQVALMQLEGVGEPVAEERPVGQAGQPVVKSLMQQLFFAAGERRGELGVVAQHQVLTQQHRHHDGGGSSELVHVQQVATGRQRQGDGEGSSHGRVDQQGCPAVDPPRASPAPRPAPAARGRPPPAREERMLPSSRGRRRPRCNASRR